MEMRLIKIEEIPAKKLLGLAAVSVEKRKEISARGGKAVAKEKRPFYKDRKLAVSAGKKGGSHPHKEKRTFSVNPELAKIAGQKSKRKKKNVDLLEKMDG
jgi:general stress protein YciG